MNTGTKFRTVLAIAIAFYTAVLKTDVADFGNDIVNLIYQIVMKLATFVVIFLITYYNNDYTEVAAKHTADMRQEKRELEEGYIGDRFFTDEVPDEYEEVGEDE